MHDLKTTSSVTGPCGRTDKPSHVTSEPLPIPGETAADGAEVVLALPKTWDQTDDEVVADALQTEVVALEALPARVAHPRQFAVEGGDVETAGEEGRRQPERDHDEVDEVCAMARQSEAE